MGVIETSKAVSDLQELEGLLKTCELKKVPAVAASIYGYLKCARSLKALSGNYIGEVRNRTKRTAAERLKEAGARSAAGAGGPPG